MIKVLEQTRNLISSLGIGIVLLLRLSSTSSAMILNYQEPLDSNQKSDFLNKLALTLINYDHYTNVASNLNFDPLTFTLEQRKDLAFKMNSAFVVVDQEAGKIGLPSLDQGIRALVANQSIIEGNPELNAQKDGYKGDEVEISIRGNEKEYDVALLPRANSIDQIYDDVYQFEIGIHEEQLNLSTGIGKLLGSKNNQSQNNSPDYRIGTYEVAQKQIIDDLNKYTMERSTQISARRNSSDPTVAQIATPLSTVASGRVSRGGSWFQFYAMGSRGSDPSALLGNGGVDYVQEQLMLQQKSRANIEQRTRNLYSSPVPMMPQTSSLRY